MQYNKSAVEYIYIYYWSSRSQYYQQITLRQHSSKMLKANFNFAKTQL